MPAINERNLQIMEDRLSGMTLDAVGKKHGVTRETVRGIVFGLHRALKAQAGKPKRDMDRVRENEALKLKVSRLQAMLGVRGAYNLKFPLDRCELSIRPSNCLNQAGLKTVGDVMAMTDDELLAIPGFGRKCLREVRLEIEVQCRKEVAQ